MMKRSMSLRWIALAVVSLFFLSDMSTADAQGLFRRIQSRIQSRVGPLAPPPVTQPTQSARPGSDPAAQRLSPVAPRASSDEPASGNEGTSSANQARPAVQDPAVQDPAVQDNAENRPSSPFGGSILSRKPATEEVAADGVKPSMGIQVLPATEGTPGLRVAGIRPGSLAGQAGLRTDDLIVSVDGIATPDIKTVADILANRNVGDTIRAAVVRGDQRAMVAIPLLAPDRIQQAVAGGQSPETDATSPSSIADNGAPGPRDRNGADNGADGRQVVVDFGIEVKATPGKRGLVVSSVRPASLASSAGLRKGDRIVSINGRLMLDEAVLERELASHTNGDELSINAVRDETPNAYDVVWGAQPRSDASGTDLLSAGSAVDGTTPSAGSPNDGGPRGGVLGGLGSVLGGLFKGPADASAATGAADDAMAFGDDEPIQRVGFDEPIETGAASLQADPPSIEELTPPASEAETAGGQARDEINGDKDQTIRSLKDEIDRLQRRLKEIEGE